MYCDSPIKIIDRLDVGKCSGKCCKRGTNSNNNRKEKQKKRKEGKKEVDIYKGLQNRPHIF